VTACAEIESMARPTEYQRFVDQARCLGTETNLSDPIDDGAICPGCVVLRMEYGNYVVNGVGPTSNVMSYIYTIIRRIMTDRVNAIHV